MGHLIYFYDDEIRSRCCRYKEKPDKRITPEGKMRIIAAFAAVLLAVFALIRVQQTTANDATPAFFSMLFPQLVPQGLFDFLWNGAFEAVLL